MAQTRTGPRRQGPRHVQPAGLQQHLHGAHHIPLRRVIAMLQLRDHDFAARDRDGRRGEDRLPQQIEDRPGYPGVFPSQPARCRGPWGDLIRITLAHQLVNSERTA